jgi:hypothetical protein
MTADKRAREQRLRERRTLKEEKKAARKQAREDGLDPDAIEYGPESEGSEDVVPHDQPSTS